MTLLTPEYEAKIINLFQDCLNQASDIPKLLELFSESLKSSTDIPHDLGIILASGIDQYFDLIKNSKYQKNLRTTFDYVYDLINEKENFDFKIEGRRKGVVNSVEKMLKILKQGKSLDLFRDSMGIRLIIYGEESEELQQKCYSTMDEIIRFMLSKHFILCEADQIPTQLVLDPGINILIPKTSYISPYFQSGVKDYVRYPKPNGYQSLHSVFRARNSSFIEIQVRTEEMHLNAEYNDACHILYKANRYTDRLHSKLDFSHVNMRGFRYLRDELIYDDIGLQTSSLTIYQKTY